jgi:hypothetical protein
MVATKIRLLARPEGVAPDYKGVQIVALVPAESTPSSKIFRLLTVTVVMNPF